MKRASAPVRLIGVVDPVQGDGVMVTSITAPESSHDTEGDSATGVEAPP